MSNDIHELMAEVGAWHRSVFGEHNIYDHVRAIGQKAEEEAKELQAETEMFGNDAGVAEEIVDLAICALACADRMNLNLAYGIRWKLGVLKARGMTQLQRDKERGIVQASEMNRCPEAGKE